ncbi:MAG: hypothetical protein RL607_1968 [Bacteroidota bacterium]|jgi:hypothetical protein
MKKIIICSLLLVSLGVKAQNFGFFLFNPSLRIGAVVPTQIGNTALNHFYTTPVGIDVNYSIFKLYKGEFNIGYSGASYRFEGIPDFTAYTRTSQSVYYMQLAYEIDVKKQWSVTPYINLGAEQLRHLENGSLQAIQNGTQVQIGGYLNFKLANILKVYTGLAFTTTNYNLQDGVSEYVTKYKKSQALVLTLGLKIN